MFKFFCYCDDSFEKYVEYLKTINLPMELFEFASDPRRHDFSDSSLHDSRVSSINLINENDSINICIALNGEDRIFYLNFKNVDFYDMHQKSGDMNSDLMGFEVGKEDDLIYFFALFSGDESSIKILSEQLYFKEELQKPL